MRLRAILLRLLLCIALVANGTSAVYASTKMAVGGGMRDSVTAAQDADSPCHEMPSMPLGALVADHDMPAPPVSHEDCCPPGACLCSCVSHAPTILVLGALDIPVRPSAAPVAALRVSFASPALPHLIRPPIG